MKNFIKSCLRRIDIFDLISGKRWRYRPDFRVNLREVSFQNPKYSKQYRARAREFMKGNPAIKAASIGEAYSIAYLIKYSSRCDTHFTVFREEKTKKRKQYVFKQFLAHLRNNIHCL